MGFASLFFLISLSSCVLAQSTNNVITSCPIKYLYQIGDSLADTGNLIRIQPVGPFLPAARPPYGETFPGSPTGRWSDGRLIIDFTAIALGLPLLNPYLDNTASFTDGVNFAVAGSTALNATFLASRGISVPPIVGSLSDQLSELKTYLSSICSTPQVCPGKLKRAIVFLGEIGGNDLNYAITNQSQSLQQIQDLVPFINQAIANAAREIIKLGARRLVVPGNFPIGCIPFVINFRGSNDTTSYDELGCLRSFNDLSIYQNTALQSTLASLRSEFPNVQIIYSDYYNAFLSVFRNAASLGFNSTTLLDACCGEAPYDLFGPGFCGNAGVPLCPDPNTYIFWDGLHLTENAYRSISQILIRDIFKKINCIRTAP